MNIEKVIIMIVFGFLVIYIAIRALDSDSKEQAVTDGKEVAALKWVLGKWRASFFLKVMSAFLLISLVLWLVIKII